LSLFESFCDELKSRRGRLGNVVVLDSVDSTNLLARRLLDETRAENGNCPDATFLALEQTAGRGRQGRTWVSSPGLGVYVTLLRWLPETKLQLLPLAVGVGLVSCLRERYDCAAELKWPNDVVIGGRKLGGVLIESVAGDSGSVAAVIGFGVNHGHREEQLPTRVSTSLRLLGLQLPPLAELAFDLMAGVDREIRRGDAGSDLATRYVELTTHVPGERMRCRVGGGETCGTFLGFDEHGFLRLEVDGDELVVASGEILE
jgi:BirA family biotin operon repressor/biotin-[acetyl-CoA-carboxylase] ligase